MLTYSFENIGALSLYEHLYHCIKSDIINGVITSGEKLPSKRSFAKNLGISTITVENAYDQLIAEGYIYSVPKKGYYVSDINIIEALHPLKASKNNSHHFVCKKYENKLSNKIVSDLTSNKTPASMFPFYTWSKYLREVIANQSDALLHASPSGGIYELRQAICHHLRDFRGMTVQPEQIIIGAGTEYLYGLILQLLGRRHTYAMEDPCYNKIRKIYKCNDVNCKSITMDEQGIDMYALLESNADILHISPSHHFPTGIVTSIKRRYELLSWAMDATDRYIIEDDYDSEFRLSGKPIPSMQSIDKEGCVIYINTFTKSLTPTIRISYMILPQKLLDKFYSKLGFYSCTVSNFEQYTLACFIETGHFEKHINRMRLYYRKQQNKFINALENSAIANIITIDKAGYGLHFLMETKTPLTDKELKEKAAENGLKIYCLSDFYENPTNAKSGIIVINYSALNSENISLTVNLLCKTLCKT